MAKPKATVNESKAKTGTQVHRARKPTVPKRTRKDAQASEGPVEKKTPTPEEARKALEALARKNTRSRSAVKRYPRFNGKVIELAPAPRFNKPPKRARAVPPKEPTAAEKRKSAAALKKQLDQLRQNEADNKAYQKKVAATNAKRLHDEANPKPPKPLKLKVRVKTEPIKVIVLKGHSYRRPCGPLPAQFQGVHIVRSDSPMFSRNGGFPPSHYNDGVPLPSLAMGVWLSEKANNELARMLKDMTGLSQRCMSEINELAKSGRYHSAPFPELRRRLVMSLVQELRENL